jgi:hypothetical protein
MPVSATLQHFLCWGLSLISKKEMFTIQGTKRLFAISNVWVREAEFIFIFVFVFDGMLTLESLWEHHSVI